MKLRTWLVAAFALPALIAFVPGAALAQCDTGCNEVGSGSNIDHYTFWSPSGEFGEGDDGWHWGTKPGDCSGHEGCGVNQDDVDAFSEAVITDDRSTLATMFVRLGDHITINADRGLIQTLNCQGQVLLSLPLSQELQAYLLQ